MSGRNLRGSISCPEEIKRGIFLYHGSYRSNHGINTYNWASEASPKLGCSIEISRDIMCVRRKSNRVESRESNKCMLKFSDTPIICYDYKLEQL